MSCEQGIVQGRARNGRCALFVGALLGLFFHLLATSAEAQEVRHLYDAKGQLVAVVDADGSAARYSWDDSGNLVGITRLSPGAGPVGISLVNPNAGRVGDTVEIFGKGLANPTSVTFNGVASAVTGSTSTYIKTTVPTGATTGLIHVVTPLGQADSPSAFTVLGAMTITPTTVQLPGGGTQQFTASEPVVTWTVNGITGGAPAVGAITPAGLYTAPSTGTFPLQVTVAAESPGNPLNRAEATVTVVLPPTGALARGVSAAIAGAPAQASPLGALGVSATVSPAPAQASPLGALGVSATISPAPAQAMPLLALGVSGTREPLITAVTPASVARGATNLGLVLTGKGLANPTALAFLLNGVADTAITSTGLTATPDGTQASVTISVASTAAIAGRVLQMTAGGASSTPAGTGANVLQVTGP